MRAAVASTGLAFEEIDEERAAEFESLSAVLRLQLAGRLSRREYLCEAAARSGKLEVLKWLRAGGCPWDTYTCCGAARSGHLEVLQWARANGCPWDEDTCSAAAEGGHRVVVVVIGRVSGDAREVDIGDVDGREQATLADRVDRVAEPKVGREAKRLERREQRERAVATFRMVEEARLDSSGGELNMKISIMILYPLAASHLQVRKGTSAAVLG
jgi:hypothetical protein